MTKVHEIFVTHAVAFKVFLIAGNPDGTDYSNCYSGWFTDVCNLPYDYTSIMHYGLTS